MRAGAYDLGAPSAPADFKPLFQPLQRLFVQALDRGPIKSGPVVDEQLMVKILACLPPPAGDCVGSLSRGRRHHVGTGHVVPPLVGV